MTEMLIDFRPAGQVEGLHFDAFPLGFLGNMTITRASEILFNEPGQDWYIQIPGAGCPLEPDFQAVYPDSIHTVAFSGYDSARKFEVSWLQACRTAGVRPISREGFALARKLRLSG